MNRIILAALALTLASPAHAGTYKPPYNFPEPEYDNYTALNGQCRGGGQATVEENENICKQRDKAGEALEALGWCYGPGWFSGFEMRWYPCQEDAKQRPFDCYGETWDHKALCACPQGHDCPPPSALIHLGPTQGPPTPVYWPHIQAPVNYVPYVYAPPLIIRPRSKQIDIDPFILGDTPDPMEIIGGSKRVDTLHPSITIGEVPYAPSAAAIDSELGEDQP